MADNDALVEQFRAVSGVSIERAKFFLESAGGDLSTALSSFYEEEAGGDDDVAPPRAMDTDESSSSKRGTAAPAPKLPVQDSDEDEDDEDSDEGQAFYAGGSRYSGQQVLGPSKGKKKDIVSRLFKAAKEHGAEVVTDRAEGKKAKKSAFRGTSYRLGETETDTQVIPDPVAPVEEKVPVELHMWSNGFSIDDGPLRRFDDPESREFLAAIKSGRIPAELMHKTRGKEISVNMNDRRDEDYVAPKRVLKAFTGSGQSLGSPAPAVIGQVSHVPGPGGSTSKPPVSSGDPKADEENAKKQLQLDDSQPATNIQVRLADGSRLIIRANHTHTVGDLRTYLSVARPAYGASEFALMTTFPHAELTDSSLTLKDANLLNSAIVAKYK